MKIKSLFLINIISSIVRILPALKSPTNYLPTHRPPEFIHKNRKLRAEFAANADEGELPLWRGYCSSILNKYFLHQVIATFQKQGLEGGV